MVEDRFHRHHLGRSGGHSSVLVTPVTVGSSRSLPPPVEVYSGFGTKKEIMWGKGREEVSNKGRECFHSRLSGARAIELAARETDLGL